MFVTLAHPIGAKAAQESGPPDSARCVSRLGVEIDAVAVESAVRSYCDIILALYGDILNGRIEFSAPEQGSAADSIIYNQCVMDESYLAFCRRYAVLTFVYHAVSDVRRDDSMQWFMAGLYGVDRAGRRLGADFTEDRFLLYLYTAMVSCFKYDCEGGEGFVLDKTIRNSTLYKDVLASGIKENAGLDLLVNTAMFHIGRIVYHKDAYGDYICDGSDGGCDVSRAFTKGFCETILGYYNDAVGRSPAGSSDELLRGCTRGTKAAFGFN